MDAYLSRLQQPVIQEPKPDPKCVTMPCPDKDEVAASVTCAIIEITATCEHQEPYYDSHTHSTQRSQRIARSGEILEVVPGHSYGKDTITLEASVQKQCGAHPVWSITEEGEKQGAKQSFGARTPVTGKLLDKMEPLDPEVVELRLIAERRIVLATRAGG
jgi:hypothetical protein